MIKDLEKAFEYKDYSNVNWNSFCFYFNNQLSEEVIEYFSDKVCWDYVCLYQKLSEEFIEKHSDKVVWNYIFLVQNISKSFIEKYKDKVNWKLLKNRSSKEFKEKYKDYFE